MKTTIQVLLVFISLAFFSCSKTDVGSITDLTAAQLKSATIAVNDVAVQSVAEEVNYEADFYAEYEHLLRQLAHFKGKKGNLLAGQDHNHYVEGQSPVVSIDTAAAGYPITISIDYGDGVKTTHGRSISGKVTIAISGAKDTDGSTRTITFEKCVIDTIGVDGTSLETFNGDNTTTRKTTATSTVKFTLADGTVLNRVGTHVREWLTGLDTPKERTDDMIQVTGSIKVESSTGDKYSRVITEPLIKLGDCRHHVKGIVAYSQNGAVIATLDYGDGECDNLANLTTGGTTVEIELKGTMPKAKTEGEHKGPGKGK
jgi:hypothetical protein